MSEIIIIKDIQIKISTSHRLVVLGLQSSYWLVILAVILRFTDEDSTDEEMDIETQRCPN